VRVQKASDEDAESGLLTILLEKKSDQDVLRLPEFEAELGAESESASAFGLGNYPEPFNPSTQITFTLPARAHHVHLNVYDLTVTCPYF